MMAAMGRKAGDMTLDKWQRMTEWFMTALALVFLFAYSWEVLARTHIVLCETVINIIWMAFIVDYVVSILLAKDKKAWFKENLLMLVSIALPIFRPLRLLRLVAVLNVLKTIAGIDDAIKLIAPDVIASIQTLKTDYMKSRNPRLHTDEVLIALSMSAVTNPTAELAMEALSSLRGGEVHSSVILSDVDVNVFKKLGMNVTCEPVYQSHSLYHK